MEYVRKRRRIKGEVADYAGYSVALSSDGIIVAVGAYHHDNKPSINEGTVRVYQWNGTSWNMLATEGDLDGETGDYAGKSVALSSNGTIVAVGASSHDSNKGTARVYTIQKNIFMGDLTIGNNLTSNFSEVNKKLSIQNLSIYNNEHNVIKKIRDQVGNYTEDLLGHSISTNDTDLLIGSPESGNSKGSVYIYQNLNESDSGFSIFKQMIGGSENGERFGYSVHVDNNLAIIGAPYGNSGKGVAYIYEKSSNNLWYKQDTLACSGGANNDMFGFSVCISSTPKVALVGANRSESWW